MVQLEERVVLPRLGDVRQDVLDLALQGEPGESIYPTVIGFEDAFYSVGLAPAEWPYLCARHPAGGVFNFRTALCGGAASLKNRVLREAWPCESASSIAETPREGTLVLCGARGR